MFKYFVSYRWYGEQESSGFGMVEINRSTKITCFSDLDAICETIIESRHRLGTSIADGKYANLIVILHWQPFETDAESH